LLLPSSLHPESGGSKVVDLSILRLVQMCNGKIDFTNCPDFFTNREGKWRMGRDFKEKITNDPDYT
jgi:hypothetical protein